MARCLRMIQKAPNLCWAAILLAGCIVDGGPARDDDSDGEAPGHTVDAGSEPPSRRVSDRHRTGPRSKIDILHVIDDSGSMCEEQRGLADAFGPVMTDLVEELPDADFRFAVVSTDMHPPNDRVGRFLVAPAPPVPSLNCRGPDGEAIAPDTADCAELLADGLLSPILHWGPGGNADDLEGLARKFRCMVTLGTSGDGFEKGLEAMRTALSCTGPNDQFFGACCVAGEYDPECDDEPDFLRPDALLVVVFLSDENDCSDTAADPISRSENSNCEWMRDALVPTAEYVDFLLGLKGGRMDQLLVAPIVGLRNYTESGFEITYNPGEFEPGCDPDTPDFDPDMALDHCCPEGRCVGRVQPSCASENGVAFSGRRYLEVAEAFWPGSGICSPDSRDDSECPHICAADFREPYTRAAGGFARIIASWCLFRTPDPVDPELSVTVGGRPLAVDEFEFYPDEPGCPGGAAVELRDEPPPDTEVVVSYLRAQL